MFKLILVDDEALALQQLSSIIDWEKAGFELTGAYTDSRAALDHIKCETINVLISDIKMPHISGLDLAKYCYEYKPEIQVVMISGFREFEYARQAIKYNVHEYLTKPLTRDSIYAAMSNIFHKLAAAQANQPIGSFLLHMRYQTLFSNLLCGNIENITELKAELAHASLPDKYISTPGFLLRININNLDSYLSTTWKYGRERFFNAIGLLVTSQSENHCFSIIRAINNSIEIIGIVCDSSDQKAYDKYISDLKENLESMLQLDIETNIYHQFNSLSDLLYFDMSDDCNDNIVERVTEYIEKNYSSDISLDVIAKHVSLSRVYFCSYYKKHACESFIDTLNNIRLQKALEFLQQDNVKVSLLHETVGYKSKTYFYKIFKEKYNITPGEYRDVFLKGLRGAMNDNIEMV